MSVVACKIYKDRIEIASDSIAIGGWGWTQSKGERTDVTKLAEMNDMVIGASGGFSEISMFQLYCATHKPTATTKIAVLEFISEFGDWKKKKTDKALSNEYYILIFQHRAFVICGYSVEEVIQHEAIGAGLDYALTALHLGFDVEKAVEVACDLCIYCEKPIIKFVVKK